VLACNRQNCLKQRELKGGKETKVPKCGVYITNEESSTVLTSVEVDVALNCEDAWGSGGTVPQIFDLGTKWR
jgi:hypothetical protein